MLRGLGMAGIIPVFEALPEAEQALFVTEVDLTDGGAFGASYLVATPERVYRIQKTPIGEEVIGSWEVGRLRAPRVEDLVDATSLVAWHGDVEVELIRGAGTRGLGGIHPRVQAGHW